VKANLKAIIFSPFYFSASNLASVLTLLVFWMLNSSQPGEAGELSGGSLQKVYFALLA